MRSKSSQAFSFFLGLVLGCMSFACGHQLQIETAKSKMYGEDIEMCRQYSETCPDFVICQHNAQRANGYPMTGKCKGAAVSDYVESDDAGASDSGSDADSSGGV